MKDEPLKRIELAEPEIKRLVGALRQVGEREQAEHLQILYARLRDRAVRVVTVGAFNQGKSTLINALIGAKVLPVALVPTTAVMTRVVSALPPGATLYYADGRTSREVSLEEVSEHLALDPSGKPRPPLRLVEVRCPWRGTGEDGLDLYDTPGFNDRPEQAEAAREAIENADILLFMLDARQPLTEQEALIWQGWAAGVGAKPLFLLNFLNLLEEEDRELALERVRTGLRQQLELKDEPELLEINALLALRARLRNDPQALVNSFLPELSARLEYYAGTGRTALLEMTRIGRLQRNLGQIYSQNRRQLDEAETKLRGWRERVARQEILHKQTERAAQVFGGVEEWKKKSLVEFEFKLLAEVENAVEQWSLPQLRQQIEALTTQRMREWLAYFERESNATLKPIVPPGPPKPLKFALPPTPPYNYTYTLPPASPGYGVQPETPFDFLNNAARDLGRFATDLAGRLFEELPNPQAEHEQRERVIAHSRLTPLVREAVARLDKQVSAGLATARPNYVPKTLPPEPAPVGLEEEVRWRRIIEQSIENLSSYS